MSKIIDTSMRLFMAVLGREKVLISKFLKGRNFYSKHGRVFFYEDVQALVQEKLNILSFQKKVVTFDRFDHLGKFKSILMVFDDSCKGNYNDIEFFKE